MRPLTAAGYLVVCAGALTPGIALGQSARDGHEAVEYRVLATKKASTLQKEVVEAGEQGFGFVGMTVAETAIGGAEVVAILRRKVQ